MHKTFLLLDVNNIIINRIEQNSVKNRDPLLRDELNTTFKLYKYYRIKNILFYVKKSMVFDDVRQNEQSCFTLLNAYFG